jgi:hypothetical protein
MKIRFNDPNLNMNSLTLRFLSDGKVIVKLGDGNYHYTLHPGHTSGIVDLHRSDEHFPEGDTRRHRTLGTLRRSAIEDELRPTSPGMIGELMSLWRPIHLGWMIRRRLGIGARLPTGSEVAHVDGISIKQGPSECHAPLSNWIKRPEFYDEVLDYPDAAYILFDCAKRSSNPYAALFTYLGHRGFVQMRWMKFRDLRRWATKWEPTFLAAWRRLMEQSVGSGDSGFKFFLSQQ